MAESLTGKVQTVTGLIEPGDLGITLPHEHVLIDLNFATFQPRDAGAKGRYLQPMTMDNLWHVRRDWRNSEDRLLADEDEMVEELGYFRRAGGRTVIDASPIGLGRDPLGLARISRGSGVQIVMGCGYYTMEVPQPSIQGKNEDDIYAEILHDIHEGFGWPPVRAGIIGEIGSSWPRHPMEETTLRAAARASRDTGVALLIHPGRNPQAPLELLRIVEEAGGDPARTIMSHIERTIFDRGTLAELAATGCYLEYDLFGQESSYYPYNPDIDMPNDAGRVDQIQWLIGEGYLERVLVSHDLGNKWRLRRYGGHGYPHLLEDVVPVMRRKGMGEDQLEALFIENPRRALTIGGG